MNAFLGRERAIVTEKPGTTRDYLEEETSLSGLPVRLVDTAGLREHSEDSIELEGMRRGKELAKSARCVLVVLDGTRVSSASGDPLAVFDAEGRLVEELGPERCLIIWNKADLVPQPKETTSFHGARLMSVSARRGEGIDELRKRLGSIAAEQHQLLRVVLPPERHDLAALAHASGRICEEHYRDDGFLELVFTVGPAIRHKFEEYLQ